jgi:glucokinase
VLLDEGGNVVSQARIPTPHADVLADSIVDLVRGLGSFDSLGVGVPGLITSEGVVRSSPNMPSAVELPLREQLETRVNKKVWVENDATCGALGEWKHGAAIGARDMWMVTLGTGIGGGLVSGGVLQHGSQGFAGEIGHMVVNPEGPLCPCGKSGCWERYASGSGLAFLAGSESGESVIASARKGDKSAIEVIDGFAHWVALGLANLANITDPDTIVIGGGLSQAADVIMSPIGEWFKKLLYAPEHRRHAVLRVAKLGEHAGAIGAALLSTLEGTDGK